MLRSTEPAAKAVGQRLAGATVVRRGRPARALAAAAAAALACGLAACSSSSSSGGSSSKGSIVFADVAPFSGPDAALGPAYLVSCEGTANAMNKAGGILGHTVSCTSTDTKGDPADAVPAVGSLLSRTPNLALVIGCTSDEAAAVVPIINSHKTVMFCMTGQLEFDHTHYPYFYRLVPPDLAESYAMTVIAQNLGYKRIALAFGNDIGSQTFVQPAQQAIAKDGMTVVANETLDLNATTFRTEAEKIVQAHPDAIMTEALGSADATLFSEIKQLNGGQVIPIIGTSAAISPAFFTSAAAAVGASDFANNFHADNLVTATSGPAYQAFTQSLLAVKGKVQ